MTTLANRALRGLGYLLGFVGAYWLVSMALDRDPPIRFEHAVALALTVPQGGTIDVQFTVFRTRICRADAKRWLVDAAAARHAIPSYTVGTQQLAGRETYRRSITIPEAAAVGPAFYQVILDYSCNPFHRLGMPIRVVAPEIHFVITPGSTVVLPPLPVPPPDSKDG